MHVMRQAKITPGQRIDRSFKVNNESGARHVPLAERNQSKAVREDLRDVNRDQNGPP